MDAENDSETRKFRTNNDPRIHSQLYNACYEVIRSGFKS